MMEIIYKEGQDIKQFLNLNKQLFENELLEEAINVRDKIEEIQFLGNINLLNNAFKVVLFVVNGKKEEVIAFGKQEGVVWAKHSLTLAFKLEWIQAIRTTLWKFLYEYDRLSSHSLKNSEFFKMGKEVNSLIDEFFKGFFISYSNYKDELIENQRQLVENLSVPIIPISTSISIIPLIGSLDELRVKTVEEKILFEIRDKNIQTLIIDLSGVVQIDKGPAQNFTKLLDGISMMGCKTVITGIRPHIVNNLVNLNVSLRKKAEVKATLQQALKQYIVTEGHERINSSYL